MPLLITYHNRLMGGRAELLQAGRDEQLTGAFTQAANGNVLNAYVSVYESVCKVISELFGDGHGKRGARGEERGERDV